MSNNKALAEFKQLAFEIIRDGDGDMECQDWINELVQCEETVEVFGNDDPPYVFSMLEDYWNTVDYKDPDTDICMTYRDWALYFQNWTHRDIYEKLVETTSELRFNQAYLKLYQNSYYAFSRWRLTLIVAMDYPRPITEDDVRSTIATLIDVALQGDYDPYSQATNVGLKTKYGTEFSMSIPKEEQSVPYWKEVLLDNIMETENMAVALEWYQGREPLVEQGNEIESYELDKNQIEALTLESYLIGLIQAEGDWQ